MTDTEYQRLSRNKMLMGTAALLAMRSTCSRGQVGVVISRNARILSSGYNGAPAGMPHCSHPQLYATVTAEKEAYSNGEGCTNAVHAEANAIAFAAKHGVYLDGSEMHTTLSPCMYCSQLIVNAGIVRVTYAEEYRDTFGISLLISAGVRITLFQESDESR